jgi:hypothetical protein
MFDRSQIVNLPLCYWLVSRMTPARFAGWLLRTPLFQTGAMVLVFGVPAGQVLGWYGLCLVAFIAAYELGYYQNDLLADGEDDGATHRRGPTGVGPLFVPLRLVVGALAAWLMATHGVWPFGASLLLVLAVYRVHNHLSPRHRVPSFVALKALQASVPIAAAAAVVEVTPAMQLEFALLVVLVEIVPLTLHYATKKLGPLSGEDRDALLVNWLVAAQILLPLIAIPTGRWSLMVLGLGKFLAWVPPHLLKKRSRRQHNTVTPMAIVEGHGDMLPLPGTGAIATGRSAHGS